MIRLHEHRIGCTAVRRFAEFITLNRVPPITNTCKIKLSPEKQYMLMMKLIAKEPEPIVEYLNGENSLRMIIIKGSGIKKDPYRCEWYDRFFLDP